MSYRIFCSYFPHNTRTSSLYDNVNIHKYSYRIYYTSHLLLLSKNIYPNFFMQVPENIICFANLIYISGINQCPGFRIFGVHSEILQYFFQAVAVGGF